jgi:hypothetical protein
MDYQCIADNGIPPRDTRTRHLVPASKHLFSNIIKRKEDVILSKMNKVITLEKKTLEYYVF